MKKPLLIFLNLFVVMCLTAQEKQTIPRLRHENNHSLTWEEAIAYYSALDSAYPEAKLMEMGMTDAGRPLHLFLITDDGQFDPVAIHKSGKAIILINNGIHPGEPEGIDASAQYAYDMLTDRGDIRKYLRNCAIAIIPVYNIGGTLERSPYYRINQNGPDEKGARRNSRFLDLNRDFAKQDSRDARAFAQLYTWLDPDVFLDTHTTNGSDHQYTVTLIATQPERMFPATENYFRGKMLPELYSRMKTVHNNEMIPYVQYTERGEIKAIMGMEEQLYYSTGYASLFNSFAFMTETLVYKPFPERVKGTWQFINELVRFTSRNHREILKLRSQDNLLTMAKKDYVLDWDLDTTRWDLITYRGYRYEETTTPITGRKTGFYNHDRPYTDTIRYYNYFKPAVTVRAPDAYIIPFAWEDVIERLQANGVEMSQIKHDTTLMVETYYIESFETARRATQGHYINSAVKVKTVKQELDYMKGDYIVPVAQRAKNYIVFMLEPQCESGFFAWNFFDSFLEGQDWYSVWGFESHLKEMLDSDPDLRSAFEKAKSESSTLSSDPVAQLQWLYQNTPVSALEKRVRLYPVGRIIN